MTANEGAKQAAPGLEQFSTVAANRFYSSSNRLLQLSIPKSSKATYWTSFGPSLQWGNQDTMWPISKAALEAIAAPRVQVLANPKEHNLGTDIPEFVYGCGRSSEGSQSCTPQDRTSSLHRGQGAIPAQLWTIFTNLASNQISYAVPMQAPYGPTSHTRQTHPGHMPSRQVETIVTPSAKAYVASEHVSQLAQAKKHVDGPFREPQWVISPGTLQAVPTERVLQLGKPRKYPDGYQPCREVIWKVTNGAMNAVPSTRMCDLSKPIVRETMDSVQFNPDAFTVSERARKAKASQRIVELAQPIKRGT
eukprot:Em0573g2a